MKLLLTLLILCGGLVASTNAVAAENDRPPNIIFILADDWGWGDLGCYGHRHLQTPHLDRLAAEGTRFTQFYVCSGVCSPSRVAFMTGQFPARLGIHGHLASVEQNEKRGMPNHLDPKVTLLPQLLREGGYTTAHFGKWHLGTHLQSPLASEYGFDVSGGFMLCEDIWEYDPERYRADSTGKIVDESIAFMKAHRDAPFYLQAWLLLTHATLHPYEEEMEPYRRLSPTKVPYKGAMAVYYGSATSADREIGRLLDFLDASGLAENTIVIFSSDNGPEDVHIASAAHSAAGSPGPFRGRKRSLYEGGIRVPFILRWPGVAPAGEVDDTTVMNATDLLPTLCHIAGIRVPDEHPLDGESVSSAFRGSPMRRRTPIFWDWRFRVWGHVLNKSPQLAMREGDWKLLMNPDRSRMELYHLPEDPSEVDNRAKDEPEIMVRMAGKLLAWRETLPKSPIQAEAGAHAYPWPKPQK